jgi:tetratricopeptide (TPR) repeat protein
VIDTISERNPLRTLALAAALAALLLPAHLPAQESSPEAAAPASPEAGAPGPDINQVNFRLLRVVSEQEYGANPQAYERIEARTADGQPVSLPVDPHPLLHITSLDSAVIRQDRYGLYHLDVHFTPSDATAYAAITADHLGQRVVWMSRDSILVDLLLTQADTQGGFSIFYGDSPLERIENVLKILQVPHTVEVAPDLIVPESPADEYRLQAMRAIELQRIDEAIQALIQCINAGGADYAYRPRALLVLGGLYIQRGNLDNAITCFEDIRRTHPDFGDMVVALKALRDIHLNRQEIPDVIALDKEIVQRTEGRGPDALTAQEQMVHFMWDSSPPSPDAEQETRRLVGMLQNQIAGLPTAQRFPYELDLISCLVRLGEKDAYMRIARARLANLPDNPRDAAVQALSLVAVLRSGGSGSDALDLLNEYADSFQASHDVESDEIKPIWDQIQAARDNLRAAIEAPSPID